MTELRLDKLLAQMLPETRSGVKEKIRKGRVSVNGVTVRSPEYKVNAWTDIVTLDGTTVSYCEYEYIMMNKPQGVLSATRDKHSDTVLDLLGADRRDDLFPAGRLDKDTEGLLLITNDGALAHELLSPKKHVDKVYTAKVRGIIGQTEIEKFKNGLVIDDEFTALPAKLEVLYTDTKEMTSMVNITIHEGKFHQIKRMFEAVGSSVLYLKRMSMGSLKLDASLSAGEWRRLTQEETEALKKKENVENV